VVQAWQAWRRKEWVLQDLPVPARTLLYALAVVLLLLLGASDGKEFYYMKF
jgi:hypothetical protein